MIFLRDSSDVWVQEQGTVGDIVEFLCYLMCVLSASDCKGCGPIITIMKNTALEQFGGLNHHSLLEYELANLYKHVKPHAAHRRLSDPVNTQIYIHNFDQTSFLPPINLSKTETRSKTQFQKKVNSQEKRNQTEIKSKRFETLPADMECIRKFPVEEQKRKVATSREESQSKKQFIEIDMLTLMTWYAKNQLKKDKSEEQPAKLAKGKLEIKQEIKQITSVPSKPAIATFIQNYKPVNEHINVDDLVRSPLFGVNHQEKEFLYFGELRKGHMDGRGVMVSKNWIFEGVWNLSKRIQGVQITPKGIYKGKFVHDQRSKVGQFFWNNGQYYSGEWLKNKKHGTGVWKSVNGDVYMGQWTKGKVHGYGSHLTKKGQKYEGFFVNFLKQGEGKQYFPNGDYFQGNFKQGRPHGEGTYKWKNGITYEGQFRQGYRQGKGKIKKLGIEYEGNFIKEKADGMGKLTVFNGDNFAGNFKRGKKEGKGIQKQNKCIYIGSWHNNRFIQKQP